MGGSFVTVDLRIPHFLHYSRLTRMFQDGNRRSWVQCNALWDYWGIAGPRDIPARSQWDCCYLHPWHSKSYTESVFANWFGKFVCIVAQIVYDMRVQYNTIQCNAMQYNTMQYKKKLWVASRSRIYIYIYRERERAKMQRKNLKLSGCTEKCSKIWRILPHTHTQSFQFASRGAKCGRNICSTDVLHGILFSHEDPGPDEGIPKASLSFRTSPKAPRCKKTNDLPKPSNRYLVMYPRTVLEVSSWDLSSYEKLSRSLEKLKFHHTKYFSNHGPWHSLGSCSQVVMIR